MYENHKCKHMCVIYCISCKILKVKEFFKLFKNVNVSFLSFHGAGEETWQVNSLL